MLPQEWFENGKRLELAANRLAYYKAGLNRSPEFLPYAWRGIGDALREQGDMSGAAEAAANEEKARQGLASSVSPQLQGSISGIKPQFDRAKFCPICGSDIPPMAQFCPRCGEPLSAGGLERPKQSSQNFQGNQQGYPQGYQQGYGRPVQNTQVNVYGLAGLIVAIIGLFVASIPLGIVALVLGGVGSGKDRTKGLANGALCVGAIDLIFGIIAVVMLMSHFY